MFSIHVSNTSSASALTDSSQLQAVFNGFRRQASQQISPAKIYVPGKALQRSLEEQVRADLSVNFKSA